MIKKIVISGWYGHGNIGDEAILMAMIKKFNKKWPGCHIIVLSCNPDYTRQVQNVRAVKQIPVQYAHGFKGFLSRLKSIVQLYPTLWAIFRCDLFIMGGGGVLSDWQPEVPKGWLKQMRLTKMFGKRTVLYAIGAGPFTTKKGRMLTRNYINSYVDEVSVRDKYAYQALVVDVGLQKEKVKIVDDPVFSLDVSNNRCIKRRNKIGINLVSLFEFESFRDDVRFNHYLKSLHALLHFLVRELPEYKIVVVPFMSNDLEFFDRYFQDSFPSIEIANVEHYKDVAEVMYKCRLFISTRFHSLVLSIMTNTPVFSIVYHSKSLACCENYNIPYDIVSDGSLPPLPDKALDVDAIKKEILSIVHGESL